MTRQAPRRPAGKALRITTAAMFVALTCILEVLPAPPVSLFKFVGFTVILSGLVLGPAAGAMVGAVSDVLGWMLHPVGYFFPGFTLTQALTGAIPAAVVGSRRPTFWLLLAGIALGQLVTSVLMVSLFESWLRGYPFWLECLPRLASQALHVPFYAWGALAVLRALERHPSLWNRLSAARR